jgi:hypothetical protein
MVSNLNLSFHFIQKMEVKTCRRRLMSYYTVVLTTLAGEEIEFAVFGVDKEPPEFAQSEEAR